MANITDIFDRKSGWGHNPGSTRVVNGATVTITAHAYDDSSNLAPTVTAPSEDHTTLAARLHEVSYSWGADHTTLVNGNTIHHLNGTSIDSISAVNDYSASSTGGTFVSGAGSVRSNDPNDRSSGWGHTATTIRSTDSANAYHD